MHHTKENTDILDHGENHFHDGGDAKPLAGIG